MEGKFKKVRRTIKRKLKGYEVKYKSKLKDYRVKYKSKSNGKSCCVNITYPA